MIPWLETVLPWLANLHLASSGARTAAAALTALAVVLACGSPWIRLLRGRSILERPERGDSERLDKLHASKKHTPTLGGVLWFSGTVLATVLWARLDDPAVTALLLCVGALAAIGFADDWKKLRTGKGISARWKFRCQILASCLVGAYVYAHPLVVTLPDGTVAESSALFLPFSRGYFLPLGMGCIAWTAAVITSTSNAVNLTDGLDGLAAGSSLIVAAAYTVLALAAGSAAAGAHLQLPHVAGAAEVAVFLGALLGGGLGFLWFNRHPARIFMGDTGSLPLGGTLGLSAVLVKQELLLLIVGGVLVAEAMSVVLQVLSFKLRRKRIFLIAPLHHHFQFKGWPERKITRRFWLAGAVLALGVLAGLIGS
jgi:phospho-N-acetylmuramoyl-pentapeptide-transferase